MKALLLLSACFVVLSAACGAASGLQGQSGDAAAGLPDVGSAATRANTAAADRVVIKSAIDLQVKQVRNAYDGVLPLVRSFGGFVAEARISDNESDTASMRLRVPSARHDELLASFRRFSGARVGREESNATEVTAEYTDLESRIRNLQRSEAQYLDLLGKTGSITDIVQVNTKLEDVRGRIEEAQGRLRLLTDSTDFATVNLTLSPLGSVAGGVPGPLKVLTRAVHVSLVVGLVLLNGLVAVAVFGSWIIPLVALGLLGRRVVGPRFKSVAARLLSW